MRRIIFVAALLLSLASSVAAQSPCEIARKDPSKIHFEDCGREIFTHKPVRPLPPTSIVPGSGFGLGAAYYTEFNKDTWQRNATISGVVTFQKFYQIEAGTKFTHKAWGENNSARDRFAINAYVKHWGLPKMAYFGLGPNTKKDDKVFFARRDTKLGLEVYNPVSNWLAIGGTIESLWPHVEAAKNLGTKDISIEKKFTDVTAPGLTKQPHFMRYEAFAKPHFPATKPYNVDYKIGYSYFQDTSGGKYSFGRFDTDLKNRIKISKPDSNLDVRFRLSSARTGSGKQVPFYYQETLGGSDINNDPALRGFADYRFRDRNLMVLQTEYQFNIKNGYGAMVFYDTGKVAPTLGGLGSARLRHSYGVGFTMFSGDRVYFKVYIGLGGGEGRRMFVGVPKLF